MQETKEKGSLRHRILTIIGIVLCVILIPILIINCTLLIKGVINEDEVPSFGNFFPMIVLTDSMYPVFEKGDLIFCREIAPEDVEVEDVITFFDPASKGTAVVTHRVLEVIAEEGQPLKFRTKGDANNVEDSDLVPAEKLIGVYTDVHIPNAGNVAMFMQTTPGLILCVFLPLLILVGYDIIRRKLYEQKHKDDKDELMRELEELRRLQAEAQAQATTAEAAPTEAAPETPEPPVAEEATEKQPDQTDTGE